MLAGIVGQWQILEMSLSVSGTYPDDDPDATMLGYCGFSYTRNFVTTSSGPVISAYLRRADVIPVDYTDITFSGMPGIGYTNTISGTSDIALKLIIEGLKVYMTVSGTFRTTWESGSFFVNGSSVYTFGSGSINSPMQSVPSAVPLFGIPCEVGVDSYDLYGWTGSATGGWRVYDADGWHEFPVNINRGGSLGVTCPATEQDVSVSGSFTNNVSGRCAGNAVSWSNVGAWPDLPRGIIRVGEHESLIYRWGLAKAQRYNAEGCAAPTYPGGPAPVFVEQFDEIYPRGTQFLEQCLASPATIEGPLGSAIYAPYLEDATSKENVSGLLYTRKDQQVFPAVVDTMADNAQMASAFGGHAIAMVRYLNGQIMAHWSYSPWFPPDSSGSSVRWDLQGADSDIDYWYGIRQQHITHPSLPSGQNSRRRVNVCAETISQSGIVGLADGMVGLPCWWGIRGHQIEDEEFPTQFITDSTSASRFSFPSGTGSVGSNITLTTGNNIEFELASFTVFPYMTTTLSDRIKLSWSDSNIGAVKLFAVGADGDEIQIGPTAGVISGNIYRIPFGDSSKWATSAGMDFGGGYLTDDYTPDAGVAADDITGATLSDIERVSSFGLLPGFSPVKIRIEITRAGAYAGAVTLGHPTFYQAPWSDAQVFHETGCISTILFKDGPMVRFGALEYFDYGADAILDPPVVKSLNLKTTIGDLWCWENNFLRGKQATDGLLARMEAEFIEGEEFPSGVTKHLWRFNDGEQFFIDSISGVMESATGPKLWYLNSYSNVPPLICFPERQREYSSGWAKSGDFGFWTYSQINPKHPHIVPGDLQPQLIHGGTDHLILQSAPDGWQVGVFSESVDNNESQDWLLRWNSRDWFTMRPWRGSASVFGLPVYAPEGNVSIDVDISNTLTVRTIVSSNLLQYQYTDTNRVWQTVDTGKECKWARVDIDDASRDRTVYIVLQTLTDEVELYRCTTFGDTLTLVRSYGSGTFPSIMIAPDGVRQIVWIEGGAVKSVIEDAEDNIIEAEFTAYASADDLGLDIAYDRKGTGSKGAILTLVEGGTVKAFDSDDGGKTFS